MDNSIPVQEPVVSSQPVPSSVSPKISSKSGVPLLIAFLVILILGLGGTVAYLLLSKNDEGGKEDNEGDEIVAENEEDSIVQTCTYNDTVYDNGESFPSTDGCNTCTCTDGEIRCTYMACDSEDPYEGWLTYDNSAYSVSFRYPSAWTVREEISTTPMRNITEIYLTEDGGKDIMRLNLDDISTATLSGEERYVDSMGTADVGGQTMYAYDCTDLPFFSYYSGQCFRLYSEDLSETSVDEQLLLKLINHGTVDYSLSYGTVTDGEDFSHSSDDLGKVLTVLESIQGL